MSRRSFETTPALQFLILLLLLIALPPAILVETAGAQPFTVQHDNYEHALMSVLVFGPPSDPIYETVLLVGDAYVQTWFEGTQPGDADDDDGDQLDEVTSTLETFSVNGTNPLIGHLQMRHDSVGGTPWGEVREDIDHVSGILDIQPYGPTGTAEWIAQLGMLVYMQGLYYHTPYDYLMGSRISSLPLAPMDLLDGSPMELNDSNSTLSGYFIDVQEFRLNAPWIEQHYEHAILMLELQGPLGTEIIQMRGAVLLDHVFPGEHEGAARDHDGNGYEETALRVLSLAVEGTSAHYGPITLRLGNFYSSSGTFEETTANTWQLLEIEPFTDGGSANANCHMFYELDVMASTLYTRDPSLLYGNFTQLRAVPSDGMQSTDTAALYDANANPTGFFMRVDYLRLNPPIETDHFDRVQAGLTLRYPTGEQEAVGVDGRASLQAIFEGAVLGAASDDDRDGRDDVQIEIVSMELSGSSSLGSVQIGLSPIHASLGEVEEITDLRPWWLDLPPFTETGSADSFFDVYFTIDAGVLIGSSGAPVRVAGRVTHKPAGPGDILYGTNWVDILNELGEPTGFQLRLDELHLGPIGTSVEPDLPPIRQELHLEAAPNPFNPRVQIFATLPDEGPGQLRIFDVRGREVITLHAGPMPAGRSEYRWEGLDARGLAVASGTYHLELSHVSGTTSHKLTLVR